MKPLAIAIVLSLAFLAPRIAQSQDKEPAQKSTEKIQKPAAQGADQQAAGKSSVEKKPEIKGFIDANADGIDDRKMEEGCDPETQRRHHKNMRARQHDRFIDNDGDGINDNRSNGMGFGHKNGCKRRGGEQ